jgi:hypothetical protein
LSCGGSQTMVLDARGSELAEVLQDVSEAGGGEGVGGCERGGARGGGPRGQVRGQGGQGRGSSSVITSAGYKPG